MYWLIENLKPNPEAHTGIVQAKRNTTGNAVFDSLFICTQTGSAEFGHDLQARAFHAMQRLPLTVRSLEIVSGENVSTVYLVASERPTTCQDMPQTEHAATSTGSLDEMITLFRGWIDKGCPAKEPSGFDYHLGAISEQTQIHVGLYGPMIQSIANNCPDHFAHIADRTEDEWAAKFFGNIVARWSLLDNVVWTLDRDVANGLLSVFGQPTNTLEPPVSC